MAKLFALAFSFLFAVALGLHVIRMWLVNMKNYVLVALVASLLSGGICGWQGYIKAETKYLAQIQKITLELSEQKESNLRKVRDLEHQLQLEQDAMSKKISEIKQQTEADVKDLNGVINNYRMQLSANRTEIKRLSNTASAQCSNIAKRADKWQRAFIELSELSRDLATERDEIANKKNLLVETYEEVREKLNGNVNDFRH